MIIINVSREARITLISTVLDFSAHIVAIVVAVICIATPQDRRLSFHYYYNYNYQSCIINLKIINGLLFIRSLLSFHNLDRRLKHS